MDHEDHVVTGLETLDHASIGRLIRDWTLVDLRDDRPLGQVDLIGERSWTNARNHHAALHPKLGSDRRGGRRHRDSQLALARIGLGRGVVIAIGRRDIREELAAIADTDCRGHLLSIAQIAKLDRRPNLASRDVGHQFVAVLDCLCRRST